MKQQRMRAMELLALLAILAVCGGCELKVKFFSGPATSTDERAAACREFHFCGPNVEVVYDGGQRCFIDDWKKVPEDQLERCEPKEKTDAAPR